MRQAHFPFRALAKIIAVNFLKAREGNVGMMFAMSVLPILLAVTLAIDFTRASDEKAKMDAAIDAAVLYAATAAAADPNAASYEAQQAAAQKYFTSALGPLRDGISVGPISVKVSKDPNSQSTIISTATYTASIETMFGDLFKPTIDISGSASATMQTPSYIDFYLLLDNSPSMGLAATDADIQRLRTLTKDGPGGEQKDCQFACHIVVTNPKDSKQTAFRDGVNNTWEKDNSSPTKLKQDYYTIAKAAVPPILLRIDMLAQAVKSLTETAKATSVKSGLANQFRMAIYTFNDAVQYIASPGSTNSEPLSSDLTGVGATAASKVTLYPYKDGDIQDKTNFQVGFAALDALKLSPGDGSTSAKPEKYVFFVTDGVSDATTKRIQGPIDPTLCANLKNRGVKIAVLYTPYLRLTNNSYYMSNIDPFISQVPVKLKECASPGMYYTADSTGIAAAMNQMFHDALRSARLTQ
ncbi:MAG: hypothetical protein K2P80_06890 [Beijerinckiaceae bacterium]|nr:hypothetical protein [Beijerinckiaceae bacterium]